MISASFYSLLDTAITLKVEIRRVEFSPGDVLLSPFCNIFKECVAHHTEEGVNPPLNEKQNRKGFETVEKFL